MASKARKVEQSIVKHIDQNLVTAVQPTINHSLQFLAEVLSQDLSPDTLAATLAVIRDTKATLEKGLEPIAKQKMIAVLKGQGKVTTEKGSREATVGGWNLSMSPYRTGVDSKKLEGLLRAKNINPDNYMAKVITYSYDESGTNRLIDSKKLTKDELETCHYEESWTVKTPTQD